MPAKRHIVTAFLLTTSVASADTNYRPQVDGEGYPLVGNLAAKGGSAPRERPRTPPPDDQVPEALRALRAELFDTSRKPDGPKAVLDAMAHFRPLCDADGYPLVGNVSSKWNGNPPMQPSAFCAAVRNQEGT